MIPKTFLYLTALVLLVSALLAACSPIAVEGTIGGVVWEDKNGNGIREDLVDKGLAEIPVS